MAECYSSMNSQTEGFERLRYELADDESIVIKPMLPNKPRGVPRRNDRRLLNGIFWVLRIPEHHGGTCRTNLVHIRPAIIASLGGDEQIWIKIMDALAVAYDPAVQMIEHIILCISTLQLSGLRPSRINTAVAAR